MNKNWASRGLPTVAMRIDLDLAKHDRIASRSVREHLEGTEYLKERFDPRGKRFGKLTPNGLHVFLSELGYCMIHYEVVH